MRAHEKIVRLLDAITYCHHDHIVYSPILKAELQWHKLGDTDGLYIVYDDGNKVLLSISRFMLRTEWQILDYRKGK